MQPAAKVLPSSSCLTRLQLAHLEHYVILKRWFELEAAPVSLCKLLWDQPVTKQTLSYTLPLLAAAATAARAVSLCLAHNDFKHRFRKVLAGKWDAATPQTETV